MYHPGRPDEEVREGIHEVPPEVKELWLRCQEIKRERAKTAVGHPRHPARCYPFTQVLTCLHCDSPYHGEAKLKRNDREVLRLFHINNGKGRLCKVYPRSQTVQAVSRQFTERVLPHLSLDANWKSDIISALRKDQGRDNTDEVMVERLEQGLANLRKQHLWGDLTDEQYLLERQSLKRQLKALAPMAIFSLKRRIQIMHLVCSVKLLIQ